MVQPIDRQAILDLMSGGMVNQNEEPYTQQGDSNAPPANSGSNAGNGAANGGFPF
jgi:hypothetical protein